MPEGDSDRERGQSPGVTGRRWRARGRRLRPSSKHRPKTARPISTPVAIRWSLHAALPGGDILNQWARGAWLREKWQARVGRLKSRQLHLANDRHQHLVLDRIRRLFILAMVGPGYPRRSFIARCTRYDRKKPRSGTGVLGGSGARLAGGLAYFSTDRTQALDLSHRITSSRSRLSADNNPSVISC